jgi:hypothetical protein
MLSGQPWFASFPLIQLGAGMTSKDWWGEILALYLHDEPVQETVAEDGVPGNFARHVFEESSARVRR